MYLPVFSFAFFSLALLVRPRVYVYVPVHAQLSVDVRVPIFFLSCFQSFLASVSSSLLSPACVCGDVQVLSDVFPSTGHVLRRRARRSGRHRQDRDSEGHGENFGRLRGRDELL